MSNSNNPAYSDDFSLKQSQSFINGVLDAASDVRQRFVSRGKSSNGWTHSSNSMCAKGFNGKDYCKQFGEKKTLIGKGAVRVPGISHFSVADFNVFDNPTDRGTDPTDANDKSWRSEFYFRNTGSEKILPIRGIFSTDVDGPNEENTSHSKPIQHLPIRGLKSNLATFFSLRYRSAKARAPKRIWRNTFKCRTRTTIEEVQPSKRQIQIPGLLLNWTTTIG